jgi:GT2 family glycosyltransferase
MWTVSAFSHDFMNLEVYFLLSSEVNVLETRVDTFQAKKMGDAVSETPLNSAVSEQLIEQRNELVELHLQMQRFLVLKALQLLRFTGWFQPKGGPPVDFFAHPDDVPNSAVRVTWQTFKVARNSFIVRLAFGVHGFLDRFRKLKERAFILVLWFRSVRSVVYPQWRYANYNKWVEVEASKRDQRVREIKNRVKNPPQILVVLSGDAKDLVTMRASCERADYPKFRIVESATWRPEFQANDVVVVLQSSILAQDALWWVADHATRGDWTWSYADSDVLTRSGARTTPKFHMDYSLEYFVSNRPAASMFVVRPQALTALSTMSSWDDFTFSLLEGAHYPAHQEIVLSHEIGERPLSASFLSAAQQFLKGQGLGLRSNTWGVEVIAPEPARWPKVSMIIPTKDGLHLLQPLMDGLLQRTDYPNFDILIVNNNSAKPETFAYFEGIQKAYPYVRVVEFPEPYNFSRINNFAMKLVDGEVLALLNNDVEVLHADWLKQMVRHAVRPDVGAVGAKLYFADGSIQHAGVVLGIGQVAGHVHGFDSKRSKGYLNRLLFAHEFSSLTCACFVLRRDVFVNSGYFSDDLAVAYNDVDFCLKIKEAGYRNIWTPHAELIHKESSTRPPDRRPEQVRRYRMEVDIMRKRWMKYIERDPAYNRQLSREHSDFRLNWNMDHL